MQYRVCLPIIRGYQTFNVEADNEEDAKEQILLGNYISDGQFDKLELSFDKNEMGVESDEVSSM